MPNKYGWLNQMWGAVGYFVDGSGFHRIDAPNTGAFPKVMLHEGVNGAGNPLLKTDPDDFRLQVVDVDVLDQIQRFGYWCVQPAYLWDDHADVLREIRRAGTKVFAHLLVSPFWNVASTERSSYQARIQDAVGTDYFRRPDGTPWQSPNFVPNITIPAVRAELVDIWTDVLATELFDGALIDPVCSTNGWRINSQEPLDYRAAGFASLEDWEGGMRGAQGAIISELRYRFPNLTLIGNGGPAGDYPGGDKVDGWWREKFPHQNPFNWFANMFGKLGLLKEPYQVSPRRLSIVAVNPLWTGAPMPGADEVREARFGLGSACLGESGFVWGPEGYNWKVPYSTWWLNQYAVDRTTGRPTRRATGWLGRAISGAYEIPSQVYVRQFQYGAVIVNGDGWPKEVDTPWPAYLVGGITGPVTRITVPARDAVFLLRE